MRQLGCCKCNPSLPQGQKKKEQSPLNKKQQAFSANKKLKFPVSEDKEKLSSAVVSSTMRAAVLSCHAWHLVLGSLFDALLLLQENRF